jgi:hypothetical protein
MGSGHAAMTTTLLLLAPPLLCAVHTSCKILLNLLCQPEFEYAPPQCTRLATAVRKQHHNLNAGPGQVTLLSAAKHKA